VKGLSRLFFRHQIEWVEPPPSDIWERVRIGALLNHTSLFEPVFAGSMPNGFLRKLAEDGAVPIADVTLRRPIVGRLFKMVAGQVIEVTRKRDSSWKKVLESIRPGSMVVIMPEGRMMRRGGLDKAGKPMTVRGGIADLIEGSREGYLVIAYSGGLHHVQAPGEHFPRLFKRLRLNLECVDIATYRQQLEADACARSFKRSVIKDLEHRRDLHCPATEETGKPVTTAEFEGQVPRGEPLPEM
jgi:hypothetical protein